MLESKFTTLLHRSFTKWAHANNSPLYFWKNVDYGGTNTFDFSFCVKGGIYGAVEVKVERRINSINLKQLFSGNRTHQLEKLTRVGLANGNPWVVILCNHSKKVIALRPETVRGLLKDERIQTADELVESGVAVNLPRLPESLVDISKLIV